MDKRSATHLAFISFFVFLLSPLVAAGATSSSLSSQALKDMLSGNGARENMCSSVKQAMGEGFNVRNVVRTAIELGNNSCAVIRCAILAGGNLEDIMKGAVDAGAPSDVVSRCCIEAGADPKEVAKNLGLGYSQETVAGPSRANPPPANTISPHKF